MGIETKYVFQWIAMFIVALFRADAAYITRSNA